MKECLPRGLRKCHLQCCLGRRSGLIKPTLCQASRIANLSLWFSIVDNVALDRALQQHLEKLDQAERVAFENAYQNISIEDLFKRVSEFDDAHNGKAMCRRCAEPATRFLRIVEQFMKGVAIGIQSYPEISSLVVGAVRIVIDVCGSFEG